MPRAILDAQVKVSAALPNAGNTVNTNAIDLGAVTPYPTTESFQVQVKTTAATGANNKNITIVVQDSADGSNFTNVASLATIVINEESSAYAATTRNYALPPDVRRYVRASAAGEATGGNAADGTLTLQGLF